MYLTRPSFLATKTTINQYKLSEKHYFGWTSTVNPQIILDRADTETLFCHEVEQEQQVTL